MRFAVMIALSLEEDAQERKVAVVEGGGENRK